MLISHMLIAVSAILSAGGVCSRTLKRAGADRGTALFFLLSIFLLSLFRVRPAEGVEVCAACIAAAAWLFGNSFAEGKRIHACAAALPLALAVGALTYPLMKNGSEPAVIAAGLAVLPLLPVLGLRRALSAAALAPLSASAAVYLAELFGMGAGGELEFGEACLTAQVIGVMASVFADAVLQPSRALLRTNGRTEPYERPTDP